MIRSISVRALLAGATVAVCAAPALASAAVVTPADNGRAIAIEKRETLTVSLANNNPSTGYSWLFTTKPNAAILKLVSDTTAPPAVTDPPLAGAPEPRTIVYKALKPGTTKLKLSEVGPSGEPGTGVLAITITVRKPPTVCSAKGLRATKKSGSSVESVAVQTLRARGTACARARHIALVAAKTELANRAMPKRIDGFKITVRKPCDACAPITSVVATLGAARVTFNLAGGA